MMTPPVTHPMIGAYLQELELLLAGIEPGERAEVLSGVREHLDGALAGRSPIGDQDVLAVLAELGPAQLVADEAYAGRAAGTVVAGPKPGVMSRAWVPMLAAVLQVVGLLIACLTAGGSPMVSTNSVDGVTVSTELTGTPLWLVVAVIVMTLPLWVAVAVLVGPSPLWAGRGKPAMLLLIPGAGVLLGVLPQLGYWLLGVNGVYAGTWAALALVLLGGGWLLLRLTRRALARAA